SERCGARIRLDPDATRRVHRRNAGGSEPEDTASPARPARGSCGAVRVPGLRRGSVPQWTGVCDRRRRDRGRASQPVNWPSMHLFALIAGVVCVILWLYLLLAHGRFWMVQRLGAKEAPSSAIAGPIAVVIPARNEADVIGDAVHSLFQQSCAGAIHIFLVDDHSADGTAEAAREAALNSSRPHALTVIRGQSLPDGWTGKLWAMQQGVEQALRLHPQFLLLTDADIQHSPETIATLVAVADHGGYDLASFMVKLHCRSLPEKLLIPAFVFFFFMLYPPEWIRNPRRKMAGAAGGCILVRPQALERAGGVAAIRGEIIDDCALARIVKRSGGKVWLGVTPDTCSLRAYKSFGEIERMIARTAFNQLQHSTWLLVGAIAGL